MREKEYYVRVEYNFENPKNGMDSLGLICFLAAEMIRFNALPKRGPVKLIVGGKDYSYEDFERQKKEVMHAIAESEERESDY